MGWRILTSLQPQPLTPRLWRQVFNQPLLSHYARLPIAGLDPADYGISRIQGLLAAQTPEDLGTLEVGLSLSLVRITSDLAAGRLQPSQVDPERG